MNKKYNVYNIDLKIEVENQFLYSNAKVNYYCKLGNTKVLSFYIHKDLEIEDISCDRKIKYEIGREVEEGTPFILESKLVRIMFDELIYENENINFCFKYKGKINIITEYGVNRLTESWIELGLYTPWFPLTKKLEESVFDVKINIDNGYKVINSKNIENNLVIRQCTPNVDCVIIASKIFKCIKCNLENINLNVYYTEDKYKDLAKKIKDYSNLILNKYKDFGKVDSKELSIVIAPREDGGGYCRPGLIVLIPKDDEVKEVDYFKFIAHELGHLWWNKAKVDTWEDWLNESFAEFSALLAIRDIFGEEEFINKISIYEKNTKNLPPIKNFNRGDDKAYQVLYMKGPLILNKLENNIGKENFKELLNKVYTRNVNSTDKFLEILATITNEEVKDTFNKLLL